MSEVLYRPQECPARIVVAALAPRSVAELALRSEGLEPEVSLVHDPCAYGRLLHGLWQAGETFVNVEHDVVPWPGAIAQLVNCPQPWCGYRYMVAWQLRPTLGCTKFGAALLQQVTRTAHWTDTGWNGLEEVIFASIFEHTRQSSFHEHTPPVAHLHDYRLHERQLLTG